jgi:hypothetical protein
MSEYESQNGTDSEGSVLVGLALVASVVAFYVLLDYGTGPLGSRDLSWELGFYGLVGVSLLAYVGATLRARVAA